MAVFYSTLRHWGWGAPDYSWPKAAHLLLDRGIPVIAVLRPQVWSHPEVQALAARGAELVHQPPLIYRRGRISELRALLARATSSARKLRRSVRGNVRPHFFINQAASYDFLDEPVLQQLLRESSATYDLFFHSNNYFPPLPPDRRAAAREFIGGANRALFNSRWTRTLAEIQLTSPIPNGGYFECPVRFDYTAPLPWPSDGTIRMASVSRIDCHHKGLDMLLRGLALLPATLPPWTFDIYGDGPDKAYLYELCGWLGLRERVRFQPSVSDVREVWRKQHLLVLVSRYEGLAVAMLEAMACGRPVIRTPNGGFAEWIVPAETGFICPAPEPQLIADSLVQAMNAFDRWPAMGRAAHQKIRRELTSHPESVFLDSFGL
jgi:glycosyltransferase involved in cell wall biosynthesis